MMGIYSEPVKPDDGDNPVNFVLSAGTPRGIWEAFEQRFNLNIHEWYGAVEGGFAHNPPGVGPVGSFGKPLEGLMEMKVVRDDDSECEPNEIGELIDVVMIGDDLTGQSGPLFPPDVYRSIVKPRQKQLVQHIRSLTKAKIWYHTCGSCLEYIPDLMDNGIDILNPVQINAEGMNPARLKKTWGDMLVYWGGGIDSQHILPFASPDKVRENVKENIEIFKSGGGYVFNNVHNIQAGVPPENIVAMYEAAYEYGFY